MVGVGAMRWGGREAGDSNSNKVIGVQTHKTADTQRQQNNDNVTSTIALLLTLAIELTAFFVNFKNFNEITFYRHKLIIINCNYY